MRALKMICWMNRLLGCFFMLFGLYATLTIEYGLFIWVLIGFGLVYISKYVDEGEEKGTIHPPLADSHDFYGACYDDYDDNEDFFEDEWEEEWEEYW